MSHFPSFFPFWGSSAPFHSPGTLRSLSFVSSHLDQSLVLLVQWVEKHFLKPSKVIKHWREAKKCVIKMLQFLLRPFGSCIGKDNFQNTMPRSLWRRVPKGITCNVNIFSTTEEIIRKEFQFLPVLHSGLFIGSQGRGKNCWAVFLVNRLFIGRNVSSSSSQAGTCLNATLTFQIMHKF